MGVGVDKGMVPPDGRPGTRTALVACLVGLAYAGISAYWASGGTWLLATVGASLARPGGHGPAIVAGVWAAVVSKVVGALVPLVVVRRVLAASWARRALLVAWVEAGLLAVYGFTWSATEILVEVAGSPPASKRRAYAWHAYLWDPWFLLWGLLIAAALLRRRAGLRSEAPACRTGATSSTWRGEPGEEGHDAHRHRTRQPVTWPAEWSPERGQLGRPWMDAGERGPGSAEQHRPCRRRGTMMGQMWGRRGGRLTTGRRAGDPSPGAL